MSDRRALTEERLQKQGPRRDGSESTVSVGLLPRGAVVQAASSGIRLDLTWVDYLMIIVYFGVVVGIGFIARSRVKSSMDFFLSGRSLAIKDANRNQSFR